MLLVSLAPAIAAPLVSARPSASSHLYAEWLAARVGDDLPTSVRISLDEAGARPSRSLTDFVSGFVRDLATSEGLGFTSMALAGSWFGTEADLVAELLGGVRSLGAAALPPATQITQADAARALSQRGDTGLLPTSDGTLCAPSTLRSGSAGLSPVFSAPRPGRGDVQPLGP